MVRYPQGDCLDLLCDGQERTPGLAYDYYVSQRDAQGLPWPEYYFSTTITTGGFLRDPDVDLPAGMDRNHHIARSLIDTVVERYKLDQNGIILPSDLGKVASWDQADYLLFWFHVLHGAQPEDAISLDKFFETDEALRISTAMENKALSWEHRKAAYTDFVKYVIDIASNTDEGASYDYRFHKKPRLVSLLDTDYSLGCFAEQLWRGDFQYRFPITVDDLVRSGMNPSEAESIYQAQTLGSTVLDSSII